jgi:hypothetical protein
MAKIRSSVSKISPAFFCDRSAGQEHLLVPEAVHPREDVHQLLGY